MTGPFGHGIDKMGHGHWPLGQVTEVGMGRAATKFSKVSFAFCYIFSEYFLRAEFALEYLL